MASQQETKSLYTQLIQSVVNSSKTLIEQKPAFDFKSGSKLILRVSNRTTFKTEFEDALKKEKVTFETKNVSGSSFPATIINFKKYFPSLAVLTVQYKQTGADPDKAPTAKTSWQERGAAYIFEQALVKNVNFEKKLKAAMNKLKVDASALTRKNLPAYVLFETFADELPKLKQIFEVKPDKEFPYVDWLNSFYFSQRVLLEKYSSSSFERFERDGGFMDYISNVVKDKFNIGKKDTWNPADVWAIRGSEQSIVSYIDDKMKKILPYSEASKKYSGQQLEEYIRAGTLYLNSILIDLLMGNNPKVVGISLKLTDGSAKIEEVNFDKVKEKVEQNKTLIDTIADPFEVIPRNDFYCNFAIPNGKKTFTQDVILRATDKTEGDGYKFQIKANSSEAPNGSNLKFELTIEGKGSARGGKVPVDLIPTLVNKIKRDAFINDHYQYPKTGEEFKENQIKGKNYKKMFEVVKANTKDIGVDYEGFAANVMSALDAGGAIRTNATCKLMAFEFLYFLISIDSQQMKGLITDMTFLAQKKNIRTFDTFGPFVKIS